jgi:hypothetical protein
MTISTETVFTRTVGNGSTTEFAFPYHFFENGDLLVWLETAADGTAALQTIDTHYTVSGADDPDGGTVTFLSAPASTKTVVIVRKPDFSQTVSLSAFSASQINDALDRLYEHLQYQEWKGGRSIALPDTAASATLALPHSSERAEKLLGFDANGDLELYSQGADSASATAAAASATAAANSATLAASKATAASSSADDAAASAADAASDATAADNARLAAEAAQAAAETAEGNASTSAANASSSASSASTAATNAGTSETNAAASEANAAQSAIEALNSRNNAEGFANDASDSADEAAASAAAAATSADAFDDVYLGSKATDPTLDNDGNALVKGQLYFNTSANILKAYNGAAWVSYAAATGITSVVEDETPQLGGDLDAQGFDITDVGDITLSGTVDGRDIAADGTKLDFITVTQSVDLDAIETRVNDLDASVVLRGTWDASSGSFPGGGSAQAGSSYIVSTGGTVDSVVFTQNDRIIAITDNASTTTFAANWFKADYTDQVLSVAGKTGTVTLAAGDIASGTFDDARIAESNVTQHEAAIDHDALTNFVANEHINHTGVTLTAGNGLTGGGDISASRSFAVGAGTGITVNADDVAVSSNVRTATIQVIIGSGQATITTGVKGYLEIPFACTITAVRALADQSGSIVVDIWKDTYANYPPTDADTITASAPVTISSATKSQDTTLTGWTTSISAGDILGFNVDSITTCTQVTVSLTVLRT